MTIPDSYTIMVNNGDSAGLKVINMYINAFVFFVWFLVIMALIVIAHIFKEDRGASMSYGYFAGFLSLMLTIALLSGFDIFPGITFIFPVQKYLIIFAVALTFYCFYIGFVFYTDIRAEKKAEREKDGEYK